MFSLTTEAFTGGTAIPRMFTCEGDNVSPALAWTGEPQGTRSFALIMDDPDAPAGTWNHWLLWDIPGGVRSFSQNYRAAHPVHSGTNDFGKTGYGGPCPPRGLGSHRYFFRVYALAIPVLGVPEGARRKELERALQRNLLGVAEYMGRFERV